MTSRPWWKRRLIAIVLTLGFSVFTVTGLLLLVFGPRIGGAVAAWFGLGGVFTLVWNVVSWPVILVLVLNWTDTLEPDSSLHGADAYIRKTFRPHELIDAVITAARVPAA